MALATSLLMGMMMVPSRSVAEPATTAWSVSAGSVSIRWNAELANELGIAIAAIPSSIGTQTQQFALNRGGTLTMGMRGAWVDSFRSGSLVAHGGPLLAINGYSLDLADFELRPIDGDLSFDLIGNDGVAWFQLRRPMYEFSDDRRSIEIATMDLMLSPGLARLIGRPEVAGWTIADVSVVANAVALPAPAGSAANFNWPGAPAPNGGVYRADLFMKDMEFQYSRCEGCSGPEGSGRVVFTPSSTLRNNVNDGRNIGYTVLNDPLGASNEPWAAGIPWYSKFSGMFPPHQNDQHPYLVWSMYRINDDGSIEQLGRSGVKHAFLTGNFGCLNTDDHSLHVLGRGCEDTYTVSHNDNSNALGPRSEIVPATGQWGRCGSIYDPSCNGIGGVSNYNSFDERLVVRESDISRLTQPGASYLFEAWYVARDDINIYNSMATVVTVPAYSNGWNVNAQSNFRLGPAIDRWVDPWEPAPYSINRELQTSEGRMKVAVKAKQVGSNQWRYDYAFANFDFARSLTEGEEPNLRLLANEGFDQLVIPIPPTGATGVVIRDGDTDASNDWLVSQVNGSLLLTAPVGKNRLNWGSLFAVSFVARGAPVETAVRLRVAQAGSPSTYVVGGLLGPTVGDEIFRSGFDNPQ